MRAWARGVWNSGAVKNVKKQMALCGLAALLLALPAAAQETAYTTTSVTLDAGPDTDYPALVELAPGTPVDLWGCLDGWTWCDVSYGDARGWVGAEDLAFPYEDQSLPIDTYGPELGLPIVVFSFNDYWDRHYRDRPFFRERDRWEHHAPPPPPLRHEGEGNQGARPPVVAPRPQPMEQRPQPVMRPPEQRVPEQRPPEQRPLEQRAPEQRPQVAPRPQPAPRPQQPAPHPQEERRGQPAPGDQPR